MKVLTHYSSEPLFTLLRFSPRRDNRHSPGGFWLSDESEWGWSQYLEYAVSRNPSEWRDAGETWKCRTDFKVDTSQLLWLKTESELHQFALDYGEPQKRMSADDAPGPSTDLHIVWDRVKTVYKGILISPYHDHLAHYHRDPKFHWYRFGCASACIWDLSCIEPPPDITIVDTVALH